MRLLPLSSPNPMKEEAKTFLEVLQGFPLLTYVWVVFLSSWGGLVRYLKNAQEAGGDFHRPFLRFIKEIVQAALAGVITFYWCQSTDISPLITAVMVAISGNMGTKVFEEAEKWVIKKLF